MGIRVRRENRVTPVRLVRKGLRGNLVLRVLRGWPGWMVALVRKVRRACKATPVLWGHREFPGPWGLSVPKVHRVIRVF